MRLPVRTTNKTCTRYLEPLDSTEIGYPLACIRAKLAAILCACRGLDRYLRRIEDAAHPPTTDSCRTSSRSTSKDSRDPLRRQCIQMGSGHHTIAQLGYYEMNSDGRVCGATQLPALVGYTLPVLRTRQRGIVDDSAIVTTEVWKCGGANATRRAPTKQYPKCLLNNQIEDRLTMSARDGRR